MIQSSSEAEYGEVLEQSPENYTEMRGNRSLSEAFAEATKEGNFGKVELLLSTTEIGENEEVLERALEDVARQGNEKIVVSLLKLTKIGDNKQFMRRIFLEVAREEREKVVELLLRFTKIGQHSCFIGFIFLEAAGKGNEKIVELFLKFTNIGREKVSSLKSSVMPPKMPPSCESSDLCIHEARILARRHKATLAILDTWHGYEKKPFMSLDAFLTDERFGIIPHWFECDWEVQEVLQMNLATRIMNSRSPKSSALSLFLLAVDLLSRQLCAKST